MTNLNPKLVGQGQVNTQLGLVKGENRKGEEITGYKMVPGGWELENQVNGQDYQVKIGKSGPFGHVTHIDAKTTNKNGQEVSNDLTVIRNGDNFIVLDGNNSRFQPKGTLDENA